MGNAPGAQPAPAAQGTLEAKPLPQLLLYLRMKRSTGRLMMRAPDGRGGAVALWRGQIVAARTAPAMAFFGAVAAELGMIERATAESTQREAAENRRLHGELLIERGQLSASQRGVVLVEQSCRKVQYMLTLPPASAFAFYEDRPAEAEPPGAVDPVAPLWRGLREGPATDAMTQMLAPFIAGAGLRIVNEAPISRAGFSADERAVCEALTARPMTLAQLRTSFPAVPAERLERIVYLLVLTSSAERTSMSRSAMPQTKIGSRSMTEEEIAAALEGSMRPNARGSGPPRPASTPSRSLTPSPQPVAAGAPAPVAAPAELGAAAIALRAEVVDDEDPFVTLGLRDGASVDEARAAYIRIVKQWHPDRLPAELSAVSADVSKIFTQMTKAHQTLTDAAARSTFLTAREERAALLHRPRKDVLRLLDTAIGKKDWSFARQEAQKLVARDANDAEAQAVIAWIDCSAAEGSDSAARAALSLLDRAITNDAQCARALFYRAMLHKRLGSTTNAYRDFTRVVALDPRHVDATREIRIHEMRMKKR